MTTTHVATTERPRRPDVSARDAAAGTGLLAPPGAVSSPSPPVRAPAGEPARVPTAPADWVAAQIRGRPETAGAPVHAHPLAARLANFRLVQLCKSPSALALDEFERLIDESQARRGGAEPTSEEKVLRGRLAKLRSAIEGLPEAERIRRVASAVFFGENFVVPDEHEKRLYQKARTSWAADVLGGLGALTNPLTAVLLPIVVKGGWDIGRMLQPLPHFISDEWSTHFLKGVYPGSTPTAYRTAQDFHDAWRASLQQQSEKKLGTVQAYVLSGVPHHVFEGSASDLLVKSAFSDAAYSAAMAQLPIEALTAMLLGKLGARRDGSANSASTTGHREAWGALTGWLAKAATPLVGLANPFAALGVAAGAATGAGLYEQFPAHRAAHRPNNEVSLAELALQMQGLISTRGEHREHHQPEHALHFSGSTAWVDRIFDEGGFPALLNLAAYAHTQEQDDRIIPTSWARQPELLEELVGEPLALDEAHRIAAAKQMLIAVHQALRGRARHEDPATLLGLPVTASAPDLRSVLATALEHPRLRGLFSAAPTVLDVYVALRRDVDGVELDEATLREILLGSPIEEKFVRELTPRTPASAWPALSGEQVRRAMNRLREKYEPHRPRGDQNA